MVYVLNNKGLPLMPTSRYGMVRHLLKDGKAKVVSRCPFTVQFNYETTNYTQDVSLGIDPGYKHIGVSVTTNDIEALTVGNQTCVYLDSVLGWEFHGLVCCHAWMAVLC
jgi:hypothetical protein